MKNRRFAVLAGCLSVFLSLSGCQKTIDNSDDVGGAEQGASMRETMLKVPTWTVVEKQWAPKFVASGSIDHVKVIPLRSIVNAAIENIVVDDGEVVEFGQTLLRFDNVSLADKSRSASLELKKALADYRNEINFHTQHDSNDASLASTRHRELEKQLQTADRMAQLSLAEVFRAELTVPVDSARVSIAVNQGDQVDYLQQLGTLSAENFVVATLEPEAVLNAHRWIGRACSVKSAALRGYQLDGYIVDMAEKIHLVITGAHREQLQPGMPVRAQCVGDWREPMVILPRKAIVSQEQPHSPDLYIFQNGTVSGRDIVYADGDSDFVPVISGLTQGEKVVVGKLHMLEPGMQVDELKWMQISAKGEF